MFRALADICKAAEQDQISFWEAIMRNDCKDRQLTKEQSFAQMQAMYQAMKEADAGYDGSLVSASGLVGKDGARLQEYVESGKAICGSFMGKVMEKAVKMGESNACMKRIVAAPTAGACGVVPAVFISMQEQY